MIKAKMLCYAVCLQALACHGGVAQGDPTVLAVQRGGFCSSRIHTPKGTALQKLVQSDGYRSITIRVRITVYWSEGAGSDRWSRKKLSSICIPLVEGSHCAVDPNVIPYGSLISLPEISKMGTLHAVDTGGGVVSRTASNGTAPVIDIYFVKKSDAMEFADKHSAYTSAWIRIPLKPKSIAQLRQLYAGG